MERKRILWLDYARCFAIICVVFIHSVERIYVEYDAHEIANLAASSLWFRNIAFAIGRLGVPLFLAISGYLLLDRDYSSADKIFKFYKHNLLPITANLILKCLFAICFSLKRIKWAICGICP